MLVRVKNKVVGVVQDGIFKKKVNGSKHFLRTPPAIAFDIDTINSAKQGGAKHIEIFDKDSNNFYLTRMAKLEEKGFEFSRGFGKQVAMVMSDWYQLPKERLQ